MRATRRRQRTLDALAAPDAVRAVLTRLRERLPEIVPDSEKQLRLMLYAVRHVERKPATDTKRGRPSRYRREDLLRVARELRALLERETHGRVSLASFIGQYLPILQFPSDVSHALSSGEINLQEAASIARLTAKRLECSTAQARAVRSEVLKSHIAGRGSQNVVRARVKEMLGETPVAVSSGALKAIVERVDEMLLIDPSDKRHIFYEEMKRLFYAMREVEPEDLDEEILDRFMTASDQLSNVLYALQMKRRRREKPSEKFNV